MSNAMSPEESRQLSELKRKYADILGDETLMADAAEREENDGFPTNEIALLNKLKQNNSAVVDKYIKYCKAREREQ
jgi:hypothetical protein